MFHLECVTEQTNLRCETQWSEPQKGLHYGCVTLTTDSPCLFQPVKLQFFFPSIEAHYIWTPKINLIRALNPSWYRNLYTSNAFTGAPVNSILRYDDQNICTWAFSDTFETAVLRSWAIEETGMYECSVTLFQNESSPRASYQAQFRIDTRPIRYDQALADAAFWWEAQAVNRPCHVPEDARHAMYSTWYSYHQALHPEALLHECVQARRLGCETIILDDGWQTADGNRGYAYCGDWESCPKKIPDMRAFCDAAHRLGMKVMLWYSVPYIGVHSSHFQEFKDRLLAYVTPDWAVLDIRYPEIRAFLIDTYESALREWDLDGFKLDFVDDFVVIPPESPQISPEMDFPDMLHAADALFTQCMQRLQAIRPDVLIEFRQTFNGPVMRRYGNMLRAVDAPMDSDENRVRITDLRLLAGSTAVHSDMLMWHYDDAVESAAMQLSAVFFSVPQLSMRLSELNESHAAMLTFYMGLWNRYRHVLLDGRLEAAAPQLRYPQLRATLGGQFAAAIYGCPEVEIPPDCGDALILNACYGRRIYLLTHRPYLARRYSCTGAQLETFPIEPGTAILSVTPADVLILSLE